MRRPPRKSAAAIAYDAKSGDGAPRVVAKGYGVVAETIIERAQEAGLYVHRSPEMLSLLMQVDLDAHVPPQLYQAVAELLAWLYRLESGAGDTVEQPVPGRPAQQPGPGPGAHQQEWGPSAQQSGPNPSTQQSGQGPSTPQSEQGPAVGRPARPASPRGDD